MEERIAALGDIAILIGKYFEANPGKIGPADSWNPAGFEVDKIETDFGWIFEQLPKPTLEQLEAIKAALPQG